MALVRAVLRASSTQGHLVFEAQEKLPPWRCSVEAADACAAASTYTVATACAADSGTVAAAAGCAINHCSASGTLERLLSPMLYIFLQSRRLRQLGKFLGVGPPGRCRRRGPPPSRSF